MTTTPTITKKKIAICFSGQARENGLGYNTVDDLSDYLKENCLHDILESYEKNFFTSEFKENVDYDIFIATDNINIEKTLQFFGKDNVKNVYLYDDNYYLNPIESKLNSIEFYTKRLYENITDRNYIIYPTLIPQYHKLAACFELLTNYKNAYEYDYIIRSRLDVVYTYEIYNFIRELINNPSCIYTGSDDHFSIGRPDIMKVYFDLINNFGTYHAYHLRDNFKRNATTIETWKECLTNPVHAIAYRYSTLQLLESLYQYCDNNNLDIDTSLQCANGCGYIRRYIQRDHPNDKTN